MGRTAQAQRRVLLGSWDSDMYVMSRLSSLTGRRLMRRLMLGEGWTGPVIPEEAE